MSARTCPVFVLNYKVPHDSFRDFVIKEDLPGFINLVGIESPGLTASPAIARLVKKMLTGKIS